GQALEISWTSESSAFVLESTSTLSTNWQPTGIAPVASGNVYTCTVPIGTGPAFYRVVAP
ncbi:MAG TPA: hypothetical protein P5022_12845, partial [Candidatus Paceibacterota bacterium]|nr:hypothetical protein [Candidatus Paceibacterota bacterium]